MPFLLGMYKLITPSSPKEALPANTPPKPPSFLGLIALAISGVSVVNVCLVPSGNLTFCNDGAAGAAYGLVEVPKSLIELASIELTVISSPAGTFCPLNIMSFVKV